VCHENEFSRLGNGFAADRDRKLPQRNPRLNLTVQHSFEASSTLLASRWGKIAPKFPTNGSLGAVDLDNDIIGTCKSQESGGMSFQLFCYK
jgi:hypothetical protein